MSQVSPGRVTLVRWGRLLWVPALCAATSLVLLGGWVAGMAYLRRGDVSSDAPSFAGVPAPLLQRGAQPGFFLLAPAAVLSIAMGLAIIAQQDAAPP